jgi:spermidine/putrescine transport system permease protein
VVVTQFVSGAGSTTLPVYVFGLVRIGVTPLINAVSVLMLVASMILVGISLGFQRGAEARGQRLADPDEIRADIAGTTTVERAEVPAAR